MTKNRIASPSHMREPLSRSAELARSSRVGWRPTIEGLLADMRIQVIDPEFQLHCIKRSFLMKGGGRTSLLVPAKPGP